MSARVELFECRWQASTRLAWSVGALMLLSALAPWLSGLPGWACLGLDALVGAQCLWSWPRQVRLTHPQAFTGLRHDAAGWWLFSAAQGWQRVQLYPDSLALPQLIVLRVRPAGQRGRKTLCILPDALPAQLHRRLRVRLRFTRRRWAAAE